MNAYDFLCDSVEERETGEIDLGLWAYVSEGGTYVLASPPHWNDDGKPHDLIAILPAPLEGSHVIPLRVTVNPHLLAALRERLDVEVMS